MRGVLSLLAGAALLAALGWWFGFADAAAALRRAQPTGLLTYAAWTALVVGLLVIRWRLVAAAVGAGAPAGRLTAARLAGDAAGALLPLARVSGDPLRALLARGDGTPLSTATAGVAIDRLLEVTGNLLAVIVYVSVFSFATAAGGHAPRSVAAGTALLLVLLLALYVRLARGQRPLAPLYGARAARLLGAGRAHWLDGIRRVEAHLIAFFRAHRLTFIAGLGLSVLIELVVILQYRALLGAFGVSLELPVLLLVLLGGGVARAVPTPAALGALEAAQVMALGAATGHPELGFVVGLIVRLHETLLIGAGVVALALLGVSPARLPGLATRRVPVS